MLLVRGLRYENENMKVYGLWSSPPPHPQKGLIFDAYSWKVYTRSCDGFHMMIYFIIIPLHMHCMYNLHFYSGVCYCVFILVLYIFMCIFPNIDIILVELLEDIIWDTIGNFSICRWKRAHSISLLVYFSTFLNWFMTLTVYK